MRVLLPRRSRLGGGACGTHGQGFVVDPFGADARCVDAGTCIVAVDPSEFWMTTPLAALPVTAYRGELEYDTHGRVATAIARSSS
mgnify:CR=1 FL=1